MSGRWFRMYSELLDDPKVQMLPAALFKVWVNLLCLTSKNEGKLPDLTAVAFALRLDEEATREALEKLTERGLLDNAEDGTQPHNWNERQYKSDVSTERVKRHRQQLRNVSGNVPPTAIETPPEAETEAERDIGSSGFEEKPSEPRPTAGKPAARTGGKKGDNSKLEEFWKGYPTDRNMSKVKFSELWVKLSEADKDLAIKSLASFREYCRKNTDYRPCHAVKYIRDRRFDGHGQEETSTAPPQPAGIWLEFDSPQFEAWKRYRKTAFSQTVFHYRREGAAAEGNYFPAEWPPDFRKPPNIDIEVSSNGRLL